MAASLLLFLSVALVFIDAKNVENSDTKRNIFDNPFLPKSFYSSFVSMSPSDGLISNNLPMLAKIIPINTQNQQIGPSVTGYVYSSEVSSYLLPSFILPCKKEATASANDNLLEPKIQELMANLENLAKKVETLAEIFAVQNKIKAIQAFEGDTQENPEASSTEKMSPVAKESEVTTPKIEEIEEPSTFREENLTTEANVNSQSDVFQCEGVTCPKTTVSCKVTERSVEPTHEKLVKTVFCFNKQGITMKQVEKKVVNPKKGSSMNSSRTHGENSNLENSKEKENFETDMKNFQSQMNSVFGHF